MYQDFLKTHITNYIRIRCEESGSFCPHWVDEKILDDLFHLDDKDQGSRARDYLKTCHEIGFHFDPTGESFIECQPLDMASSKRCDYKNEKVSKTLHEEFMEVYKNPPDLEQLKKLKGL